MKKILCFLMMAFIALPVFAWSQNKCTISDITIEKLRSRNDRGYIFVTGIMQNSCLEPVGVEVKLVLYDKEGYVLSANNSWPASTKNITNNSPYPFELMTEIHGKISKFTVEPVSVNKW